MAPSVERTPPPQPDEAILTMLRLALDGLPLDQHTAIQLAVVDRMTVPEIASQTGHTRQEVLIAMREGLYTLADVLEIVDPESDVEQGDQAADQADSAQ